MYRSYAAAIMRMLIRGFGYRSQSGERRVLTVRNPSDVEELCQEAFSQFFKQCRRGAFDTEQPVAPYLRRIACNLALRRIGRGGREEIVEASDIELQSAPVSPPSDEARDAARLVAEFREGLDETDDRILRGYFVEDISQQQLADALGLSRDQVYRRIVRLRRQLREHCAEKGWPDER